MRGRHVDHERVVHLANQFLAGLGGIDCSGLNLWRAQQEHVYFSLLFRFERLWDFWLTFFHKQLPVLSGSEKTYGANQMLKWAVIFLVIALVAAIFGFGFVAGAAAGIAKILFFLFIVVAAIMFILGATVFRAITH